MKKLILVTFGFLGWAFYEMSGGQEFEPGQVSAFSTAPKVSAEPVAAAPRVAEQTVTRAATAASDLTKVVAVQPVSLTNEQKAAEVLAKGLTAQQQRKEQAMQELVAAARAGLKSVPEEMRGVEPGSAMSSKIVRYVTPGAAADADPAGDLRRVSGNAVNMRNGPGTKHGVLVKLSKGDQVAVLRDNGDGWLKIRVNDSGRVGWIADFLVTSAN